MKITASNVWITSDTHYSHTNICIGQTRWKKIDENGIDITHEITRPFQTIDEMNQSIVEGINSVVDKNDWLIHLGDWSFGGFESIKEFRDQIECKNIVLILGNHDNHIQRNASNIRKIFTHVANYEELSISKNQSNSKFILCHYPIISWNRQRNGSIMLHGHVHSSLENRIIQKNRMDVGLCGSPNFRPYSIEEIFNEMISHNTQNNN